MMQHINDILKIYGMSDTQPALTIQAYAKGGNGDLFTLQDESDAILGGVNNAGYRYGTLAGIGPASPGLAAAETVTRFGDLGVSGATQHNPDPVLGFPTVVGAYYEFSAGIFFNATGGTPAFTVGCGEDNTPRGTYTRSSSGAGGASQTAQNAWTSYATVASPAVTCVAMSGGLHIGAGGNFRIAWGKDAAAGTAYILRGSWLTYRRCNA